MKRICAWCNKELAVLPESGDVNISHGICDDCMNNIDFHMGVPLEEYVNSFAEPIAVINAERKVIFVNEAASSILEKSSEQCSTLLPGEVFECAYARLPGGCGRTEHCSGCAIRFAVTETYKTREPVINQPATLKQGTVENNTDYDMLISTEMAGEYVLLRIDNIKPA